MTSLSEMELANLVSSARAAWPELDVDEDGFVRAHEAETTWLESRPFSDMDGYRAWALRDIERARTWKSQTPHMSSSTAGGSRHTRMPLAMTR